MAKIKVQLWDPHRPYDGVRAPKHEEPVYTDTPAKKKSRLRDKRKKRESDQIPTSTQSPSVENTFVSKVNWLGRRERGIDPY